MRSNKKASAPVRDVKLSSAQQQLSSLLLEELKPELIDAVVSGSLKKVKTLVNRGYKLNGYSEKGYTALLIAAQLGHEAIIVYFLDEKSVDVNQGHQTAKTNAATEVIQSPQLSLAVKMKVLDLLIQRKITLQIEGFMVALFSGEWGIVEKLLAHGIKLDQQDGQGATPLLSAVSFQKEPAVKWLLEHKADPDIPSFKGIRPLMLAVQTGQTNVAQLIKDASKKPPADLAMLMSSAQFGKLSLTQYCIKENIPVDATNAEGETALMQAAQQGQVGVLNYLIEQKANVNHRKKGGQSVLIVAAGTQQEGAIVALLLKGANVNHQDEGGFSALHLTAKFGLLKSMKRLLSWKGIPSSLSSPGSPAVDVNLETKSATTPLVTAIIAQKSEAVALLLTHPDLQVDKQNHTGATPLILASFLGYVDIIEQLLARTTVLNHKNKWGISALSAATRKGNTSAVIVLLKAGAEVDVPDYQDATPLIVAADKGLLSIAAELIKKGAQGDCEDVSGYTALHRAVLEKHAEVVELLLDAFGDLPENRDMMGITAREWAIKLQEPSVLSAFARYDYKVILQQVCKEKLPVHHNLAQFFQEQKIEFSALADDTVRMTQQAFNPTYDLLLNPAQIQVLCRVCSDKKDITKFFLKFIQKQKDAVSPKGSEPIAQQMNYLRGLESDIKQVMPALNLIQETLLDLLGQSKDHCQSRIFVRANPAKVKEHQQKDAERKTRCETLVARLTEQQTILLQTITEQMENKQYNPKIEQQAKLWQQQLAVGKTELESLCKALEQQLRFQKKCIQAARKQQERSAVADSQSSSGGRSSDEAHAPPLVSQPEPASEERKQRSTHHGSADSLSGVMSGSMRVSVDCTTSSSSSRMMSSPVYASTVASTAHFFKPPQPHSLGELTQVESIVKIQSKLWLIRQLLNEVTTYQHDRILPSELIKNALLWACAQFMENLKGLHSHINPFSAELARHFRNVIYHAPELFLEADSEVQVFDMALQLIRHTTDHNKKKALPMRGGQVDAKREVGKIKSSLFGKIVEHKLQESEKLSVEYYSKQLKDTKRELKSCETLAKLYPDIPLLFDAAQQFALAKMGIYTAKIRDSYPEYYASIKDDYQQYLSIGASIRHGMFE